ncbi:hypothetical protein HMPREF1544_04738 [Mucor circinelloides 1006PhL]|uniref:LysM domain-containing protein n=1 Tax=Mucor circinelloides f. circinelloides (strain 1006PhL) TaxID=1220926 RepID=S2K046_MUCC1|nr:hypothetical protein HMPREF1544_04738 [Mucor circinelloides 1006PhL]
MRFSSLAIAAIAVLSSSASAAKATSTPSLTQYTVTCQKTYVVKNGDTCSKIGKAFNVYTSYIKKWNPSINAGCTNLYIDQILCLSAPTTHSSAIAIGTNSLVTPTPTPTKSAKTTAKATTVLTMTNAAPQCTKDADCAGARCCNLQTNECVLDPYNTLCGKQSASSLTSSSCTAGSQGLAQGDGYNGACCNTQADCWDDCISGVCNGPVNTKTATATTKTTSSPGSSATCTSGSKGLGKGDGYNGACCATQADCWDDCISGVSDCWDDCISGVCNGPVNTKTATATTKTSTATATATPSGLVVQLSSSKDFCLFLPPSPGNKAANGNKVDIDAIADSEKNAVSFCTKPNVNAPAAAAMPSGFIKSASYQTNTAAGFVQVRGTLNIASYELSSKDQGGQYDNHGAGSPPNSMCAGYPYYVSLIEPNTATFCIRCCETYSDCNAGRSAYGCDRVVPAL